MINILYFKSVRKVDMAEIVPLSVATVYICCHVELAKVVVHLVGQVLYVTIVI